MIRNFKSIENLTINFKRGANLIIGPNDSGKSNILEAIYFLRKSLLDSEYEIPYMPHLPYNSGRDLIFMKDEKREVEYILNIDVITDNKNRESNQSEIINQGTYKALNLEWNIKYRYVNDTLYPVYHSFTLNGKSKITFTVDKVEFRTVDEIWEKIKNKKQEYSKLNNPCILPSKIKGMRPLTVPFITARLLDLGPIDKIGKTITVLSHDECVFGYDVAIKKIRLYEEGFFKFRFSVRSWF